MIATIPQPPAYLSALLPRDQIFELEPEFNFEASQVKKRKEAPKNDEVKEAAAKVKIPETETIEEISVQKDAIDNPYLRPAKVPKNIIHGPTQQNQKRDILEAE